MLLIKLFFYNLAFNQKKYITILLASNIISDLTEIILETIGK